jgi:kinesin family member C1
MGMRAQPKEDIKQKRMLHTVPAPSPVMDFSVAKRGARAIATETAQSHIGRILSSREASLCQAFERVRLASTQAQRIPPHPASPSKIPRAKAPSPQKQTYENVARIIPPLRAMWNPPDFPMSPAKSPSKSPSKSAKKTQFLTRFSNLEAWDPEEHYGNMERMYQDVVSHYKDAMNDNTSFRETNNVYKQAVGKLEEERSQLMESIIALRAEVETTKYRLSAAEREKLEVKRDAEEELDEVRRQFRIEMESVKQSHRDEIERLKGDHREEQRDLRRRYDDELKSERSQRIQALSQASTATAIEKQKQQLEMDTKEREISNVKSEVERINAGLSREQALNDELRQTLANAGNTQAAMENARQALQAKIDFLESDNKSQSEAYARMEHRMNEAIAQAGESMEKLRKEETMRRKLHNQVQELKGNIRVFCRVRPIHPTADAEETAKIAFPDVNDESKQIEVRGPEETNSLGKVTTKKYDFDFDHVFNPAAQNGAIFDEISQLIQSALDGFNVCIFAYGQTGSGKTFTMSSEDGMIPLALRQIYSTSKELESRGWTYTMEGSFIEVYNEEIRDLLGDEGRSEKSATKKHEIHHDTINFETTITNTTMLRLDSQDQVEGILEQAMSRRSIAATSANERSSRSHSVFILKLRGYNSITDEHRKGTLNLVDLAGSERLNNSKVEGARLKETQNINKSLSCLGDVISALGQQSGGGAGFNPRGSVNGSGAGTDGAAHIPYRNSKLTYLLQYSLSGQSKTLMFVMVAPEKKHLQETITSLKFAEKVGNTRIGVATSRRSK